MGGQGHLGALNSMFATLPVFKYFTQLSYARTIYRRLNMCVCFTGVKEKFYHDHYVGTHTVNACLIKKLIVTVYENQIFRMFDEKGRMVIVTYIAVWI